MFFCAEFDHRQPRMQLLQMLGGVLGRRFHRLAEVLRHRVEPGVHGLLQLDVRVLQPTAHGIEPRVELAQPLLGRGVDGRSARARQQQQDGGDADGDHHGENDEGGFQHGRLLP